MTAAPRHESGTSAAVVASTIRFVPARRWHRISKCERYAISEVNCLGVASRDVAWRRGRSGAEIAKALGTFDSLIDAESSCRRDEEAAL